MAPLSDDYTLIVRQGPEKAKVAGPKEKERKPVDPPPIVQIQIRDPLDPAQNYLQSPYLFMCANLCNADLEDHTQLASQTVLSGTLVSSLHRLKDVDNSDGGFFVFGDLSVKVEGDFRLRFSLFEMLKTQVVYIKSTVSAPFTVFSSKAFPGMSESTFMSRSFGDQGVRLRIRKEPRTLLKRPHTSLVRSEEHVPTFEDPAPSAQRNATLHSHRPPMEAYNRYTGVGEPAAKRQRTSVDLNDRALFDADRYGQRPYMDQRAPFGTYTAREQAANVFSPAYSQGPQSALSTMSEYSYGHQRTNSSNTSSPFVSPHTEVSGHSWPAGNLFYQPSIKDTSFAYPQSQFPDMQLGRPPQLVEPYTRQRDQNFTNRLPISGNFSYSRPQEADNGAVGTFGHVARSMPMSSHHTDAASRLLPTDQILNLSSPDRQQYPSTQMSNVLPPLESTVSSHQHRGGSQQILPSTVLPSIEPQTLDPNQNQPVPDHGQESFDGQENYVATPYNYPHQTSVSSRVKEIRVRAQWDGEQEHAAMVSINYIVPKGIRGIEGQPGTRVGLVYTHDPLIASQGIHSTVHEWLQDAIPVPQAITGYFKELSGNTWAASETRNCSKSLEQEATRSVKMDDPFGSSSTVSTIEKPCKSPKYCLSTAEAVGMHNTNPTQNYRSSMLDSSDSSDSNDKNAEGLLYKTQCCSQPRGETSPTIAVWPIRASRRVSYKRRHTMETPTRQSKKPTTVPRHSMLCQSRPVSRCVTSRALTQPSSSSYGLSGVDPSELGVVSASSHDTFRLYESRSQSVPLIERPTLPPSIDHDHGPMVRPSSSIRTVSQKTGRVPTCLVSPNESPRGWLCRRFCSRYWYALRQGTPKNSTPQSWSDASDNEAVMDVESGVSSVASEQGVSMDAMIRAPDIAPPSTVLSDGTIFVCFPEQMPMGIYEVQLDLDIFLSQPDKLRWQSFGLPSLLTETCNEAKGTLEFSVVSQTDHETAAPAQFRATGGAVLQDVHPRWLKGNFAIHQAFLLRVRLLVESHRIEIWDTAITIYSTIIDKDSLGMNIKHSVDLTVMPRENLFAKRFVFAILIKNGPHDAGVYRLKSGQCLLRVQNRGHAVNESHDAVEILVERDCQDMDKRLGVKFTCNYPDMEEASISLPAISSGLGSVLSEKIWLLKPFPPLKLHAVSQRFLSTWNISKRKIGKRQILCFDRKKMPPLYPSKLAEDANVHVHRLPPVIFSGSRNQEEVINNGGPYDIIPALDMIVDITPEKRLECRLFFVLEAGNRQRLVQIDASGWEPKYAIINGRLCTERDARWWYDDLYISLFQSPKMVPGDKLRIEIAFLMTPQWDQFLFTREKGDQVQISYPLPRITDKTILGGNLKCNHDNTLITVMHKCSDDLVYEDFRFFNSYGQDNRRLPSMHRGHELVVNFWMLHPLKLKQSKPIPRTSKADNVRFSGGLPLLPRLVHFSDENQDNASDGDDECDSPSSSSGSRRIGSAGSTIVPENVRRARVGGQPPNRGQTKETEAQDGHESCLKFRNFSTFVKDDSMRKEDMNLHDFADEPEPDASIKGKTNTNGTEMDVGSNDQDGSKAKARNLSSKKNSDDCDGASHATAEHDSVNGGRSTSAAGENTPETSDNRSSDTSGRDASGDEDEGSDFEAANGDGFLVGMALIDYLIEAVLRVVRFLEGRSPMHYLIRFFILECIVCMVMPGAYFGGQPARAVQSVVSNVLTYPGQMFLGDLDTGFQPMSEARQEDQMPTTIEPAAETRPASEGVLAAEDTIRPRRQSLRDRIDLALGWRPLP
ncbi:MAG: hypothetical protein Q9216_005167 [Gyalolechia sp. 2 TL-2023]